MYCGLFWVLLQQLPIYFHVCIGPAVILNQTSTIVVEPGCVATITKFGDIEISVPNNNLKVRLYSVSLIVRMDHVVAPNIAYTA